MTAAPGGISIQTRPGDKNRTDKLNFFVSVIAIGKSALASNRCEPATSRTYFASLHEAFVDGRHICTLGYSVSARDIGIAMLIGARSLPIARERESEREIDYISDSLEC